MQTPTAAPLANIGETTSSLDRTSRSWKLPVGRTRGASFSMPRSVRRVKHTRYWSGSGSSTTSRTGRASGQIKHERRFVKKRRTWCSVASRRTSRNWPTGRPPKSALGKALTYASNQWQALCRYTEDGRLTIDNNVSERTLRPQAIGRKNWLFLGSQQAGPRAAVLCTILAGAKRHRIEPWAYVRELLLRLHAKDDRLDAMLPDRWAADHPEAILTYRLEESRHKAARQRDRRRRRAHRRPM